MTPAISELPIIVIGAGPTGLAAAAHLLDKGVTPLVLEGGDRVGANVLSWAHVRMFSPWEFNVDRVAARMLEATGWAKPPASEHPTGGELVRNYLQPLAALPELRPHVRLGARVTGVSRLGLDRLKTAGRESTAFVLHVSRVSRSPRPRHRPQYPLLWHGAAPWRGRTPPARARLLLGGHEELRSSAELPHAHGLRAGALHRLRSGGRRRGRSHRRAHPAGDGRV